MSIKAFPLNQTEYSYNAQDVMKYYAGRNSGVFETGDNLKVSANGGLEIRVNSGMGWLSRDYVASVAFWNESVEYLMVDAGHDTYDRIDLVVVSWNFVQQEQNPKLIIRKGTPASSPAVPSLVNNSSTIEIALARINVGKGAITLSDSDIVDLRGNDTYCPMVYDEQTIKEAFRKCVGYADGVNKISDFPSVTPASSDKILIEQGGEGKSATLADLPISTSVQSVLDTKVNHTDSLTYEEIMATTDLTNKVASANSVKSIKNMIVDIKGVPFYNYEQIGAGTDTEAYFKAWLNKIYTDHKDVLGCPIIAHVQPTNEGIVIGYIYRDTLSYAGFVYIKYSYVHTFGYNNGTWYYRQIT